MSTLYNSKFRKALSSAIVATQFVTPVISSELGVVDMVVVGAASGACQGDDVTLGGNSEVVTLGSRETFPISFARDEWTEEDENRFERLVIKDSLGNATKEEASELRRLEADRNRLCLVYSPEEILHEEFKARRFKELKVALEGVFEIAKSPWATSRKHKL